MFVTLLALLQHLLCLLALGNVLTCNKYNYTAGLILCGAGDFSYPDNMTLFMNLAKLPSISSAGILQNLSELFQKSGLVLVIEDVKHRFAYQLLRLIPQLSYRKLVE